MAPIRVIGAAEVSLSDEDMAAIEARVARIEVTGERLPPAILELSYRYSPPAQRRGTRLGSACIS